MNTLTSASLRRSCTAIALAALFSSTMFAAQAGSNTAPSQITQKIDNTSLVTLAHNVRPELNAEADLGPVEDSMQIQRMYLVLQRSPEQQGALTALIERQHQQGAPEFHQWLTPQQFGEKFGASKQDIATITAWLESQGFSVHHVLNNNSMIQFSGTAGIVRQTFHTELHRLAVNGDLRFANAQNPQIPAALAPVIGGIVGLENIPFRPNHTAFGKASYDQASHAWSTGDLPAAAATLHGQDNAGGGNYFVSPGDYYTIYNATPLYNTGEKGAAATIAVIEQSDIVYGMVNGTTGAAPGGDVSTFRSVFGISGTLNMFVYHGFGSDTCTDPGIIGDEGEATLDAEWATALAPSAKLIFMSCDIGGGGASGDDGIFASLVAVIDNNLADAMSMSYGSSELSVPGSEYTFLNGLYTQAATQGQSVFVSAGDSGSDVADQNTSGTATSGINVSALSGSPYVTSSGGTDFQDFYDANFGGPAQTTYWGASNNSFYADALGYVPETPWNNSCASSLIAQFVSTTTPQQFCGSAAAANGGLVSGDVVGGSGGFSTHYSVPSYQSGITGYSGTKRAQPDIAMFAANGVWGHALIFCDSTDGDTCSSGNTFGLAGGTSFVAPQMVGIAGLLMDYTGSRQGVLNYGLYALAKAQFTNSATKTACYANGQTNNIGVTTGLPASSCIFRDITTSNNDVPCASGALDCYVASGLSDGLLSTTGSSSLTVAYNSGIGYDETTGIGSINIYNLITKWSTAFTSSTSLSASASSITTSQSVKLTATVTGGTPSVFFGKAPTLSGSVKFLSGSTQVATCTLSSGTCNASVSGSTLGTGTHSITATFYGSNAYPTSTSTAVSVTVTSGSVSTTTSVTASPSSATAGATVTLKATVTASSGTPTGTVTFTYSSTTLGSCPLSSGSCSITYSALPVGSDTVTASYGGATGFATSSGTVSVTINKIATTTAVTFSPSTITVGATATLKATVTSSSGTPTGTVAFFYSTIELGSCNLSSGSCSISASANVPPGSYDIVANYTPTGNFAASSGSKSVSVGKAPTTVTFSASPNPVTIPATVTLQATVKRPAGSSGVPTGSVTFSAGSIVIGTANVNGSGVAMVSQSTGGIAAGTYSVKAAYNGDSDDGTSSGSGNVTLKN